MLPHGPQRRNHLGEITARCKSVGAVSQQEQCLQSLNTKAWNRLDSEAQIWFKQFTLQPGGALDGLQTENVSQEEDIAHSAQGATRNTKPHTHL